MIADQRQSVIDWRPPLGLVALAGLAFIVAIVGLSVYVHAVLYVALACMVAAVVVVVLHHPVAITFLTLGWLVLEKSFERPGFPISDNMINTGGDALLIIGLVVVIVANLMQRREPAFTMRQIGAPLLAFLGLGVASALANGTPLHVASLGLESTTHSMIMFLLLVNVALSERHIYRFIGVVIGSVGIISVLALFQLSPSSPFWKLAPTAPMQGVGSLARVQGIFDQPIGFGDLLAMVIPMCLMLLMFGRIRGRQHALLVTATAAMVLALVCTFTREAWAAVPVAMLVIGLTVERKLLRTFVRYIVPGLLVVIALAPALAERLLQTTHGNTRFRLLARALPMIRDHLWLGVGPGRFGGHVALITNTPIYAQYKMTDYFYGTEGQVDMFWTHLVGESGVLGTLAFFGAILACFLVGRTAYRRTVDPRRRAVLLGLLFSIPVVVLVSFFSSTLEVGSMATFFWGLMGMLTVLSLTPDPSPEVGDTAT